MVHIRDPDLTEPGQFWPPVFCGLQRVTFPGLITVNQNILVLVWSGAE